MSTSPRMDGDKRAVFFLTHQWTHITDADGFPLCCNEPQPAPKTAHGLCPICKMIKSTLPDTVTVEPLPSDELSTDDLCPLCLGDEIIYVERIVSGRLHLDAVPCECQIGKRR